MNRGTRVKVQVIYLIEHYTLKYEASQTTFRKKEKPSLIPKLLNFFLYWRTQRGMKEHTKKKQNSRLQILFKHLAEMST